MKVWTDYPIVGLGDKEGQEAPIREAKPLSYDGDKYVLCSVGGIEVQIKSGYLYMEFGRHGTVPALTRRVLSNLREK